MSDEELLDGHYMRLALDEARRGGEAGEVPVGAVVVCGGRIVAKAHNMTERLGDVTAHAEMLALTAAANALGGKYLPQCTLYVTLEPCPMCAGAIGWSQIGRVVWGASDPKRGFRRFAADPKGPLHKRTTVCEGVLAEEGAALMKSFFGRKR